MKRIKLTVAYDGTNYCGFQIQQNGITIEEVLNRGISKATNEEIKIIGASRTDSGVHALGNVVVFDTHSTIPADRMVFAINRRLPKDIVVTDSQEVSGDWHPRYQHNIEKVYEYHILNAKVENPMKRLYSTFISFDLNIEEMRKGAAYLLGEHDFASFCNIKSDVENTIRTIYEIDVTGQGEEIVITVRGNGFLYNMVRIIAGILIRVGRGFYEPEKVKELLEAKVRTRESITAPAQGLVLKTISYEKEDC